MPYHHGIKLSADTRLRTWKIDKKDVFSSPATILNPGKVTQSLGAYLGSSLFGHLLRNQICTEK